MQVAISTTDREPAYVHTTLKTMFAGAGDQARELRIRCVVAGVDDSYLGSWCSDERISTEVLSKTRATTLRRRGKKQRIFHNTLRCLQGADHSKPLLFCQDDVSFTDDWRRKLHMMLTATPKYLVNYMKRDRHRFVLALYAAYPFKNRPLAPYPTQKFYGNQCLFIPSYLLPEITAAMTEAFSGRCSPDDIWLKEWCVQNDIPILCGVPNLVQHIGGDSTIDSRFHTSPTFQP